MKGISVIICCYNSASRLSETLSHLSKQNLDAAIPTEVIIINNNSTDNTHQVAIDSWCNLSTQNNLLVIDEPIAGLSYAREKGFMAASYEYILLCDDDNWLEENYLQVAFDLMESDEMIGAAGGQSEAVYEVSPPWWFKDLNGSYAIGKQHVASGDVTEIRGYLWGAGLVIRKSAWVELSKRRFSSILSDRKGKTIASGGDGEICAAIRLLGYKIYYEDRLRFQHYMTKERLTWQYYMKLLKSFGQARVYLSLYDYVIRKHSNGNVPIPQEYWRQNWKVHKQAFFKSYKALYRLFFRETEGDYTVIDLQMKLGSIVELFKIKSKYGTYIQTIEDTFSNYIPE